MRVLLATSWGQAQCGIQAHSESLIAAVGQADPGIEIVPSAEMLDPQNAWPAGIDLLHLNYHRGLHSRWTAETVRRAKLAWSEWGYLPVIITYHDTTGENPPDQLTSDLCALADAFIVHEPCQGLEKAIYWRMGVPTPTDLPTYFGDHFFRPYLGTVGFDFPWKNFTELAKVTGEIGWGFCLACPAMSPEREAELVALNPYTRVRRGLTEPEVLSYLQGCDATAFMYTCANTGQSAAILQGIGARKPVYALQSCRQFRALAIAVYQTEGLWDAIRWVDDFPALRSRLLGCSLQRLDPHVVRLAEQDSWTQLGAKYAALYREVGR